MARGIITETGRSLLCQAHAGDIPLPAITQMAFGDGGVNPIGEVVEPTGMEEELRSEFVGGRMNIYSHNYLDSSQTACRYTARLSKKDLPGAAISELGLIDEEDNLIAYKTFSPKVKDDDMEFIFDMDEVF